MGIKSTALRFGNASKTWFWGFAATEMALLTLAGVCPGLQCSCVWHFGCWVFARLDAAHMCLRSSCTSDQYCTKLRRVSVSAKSPASHQLLIGNYCAGVQQSLGPAFYAGLLAAGAHQAWQICTVDLSSRADCSAKFGSNRDFGALVFAAIVAGKYLS